MMTETLAPPALPLLEITAATVWRGTRRVLDSFNLRVAVGAHTAILGPNGSGKSTLVQLIARQLYPQAGAGRSPLRIFGRERWDVGELRRLLGIVSPALQQDCVADADLEVFDAVVSGFFAARGLGLDHQVSADMRARATVALQQAGATALVGRSMASLSTGEARRVLIARALVHQPRALLLDEPCAGLDMLSRQRFLAQLRALARAGTTLLLVTHHVEEVLPEIQQVLLLREGRVLGHDSKAATLTAAALGELFGAPVELEQRGAWYRANMA